MIYMVRTFNPIASFDFDLSNKKLLNDVIDLDLHHCELVTNYVCTIIYIFLLEQWTHALHGKKSPTHQLKNAHLSQG